MTDITQEVEVLVQVLCPGCKLVMMRDVAEDQPRIYCHSPDCPEKGILHYPPQIRIRRFP